MFERPHVGQNNGKCEVATYGIFRGKSHFRILIYQYFWISVFVNSIEKWTPNKRLKKTMAKRKDGVDEIYRDRYMKWAGRTHKGKHPSHLVQGTKNVFPPKPDHTWLLSVMPHDKSTIVPTDYRYKRHFRLCHVKHTVIVGRITLLACKCFQVKS